MTLYMKVTHPVTTEKQLALTRMDTPQCNMLLEKRTNSITTDLFDGRTIDCLA